MAKHPSDTASPPLNAATPHRVTTRPSRRALIAGLATAPMASAARAGGHAAKGEVDPAIALAAAFFEARRAAFEAEDAIAALERAHPALAHAFEVHDTSADRRKIQRAHKRRRRFEERTGYHAAVEELDDALASRQRSEDAILFATPVTPAGAIAVLDAVIAALTDAQVEPRCLAALARVAGVLTKLANA